MITIDTRPPLNDVLVLQNDKVAVKELLKIIDEKIAQMLANYGAGRFDYDLGENVEGERYLKFEITDNIESFENGEKVWKSVAFKPVSYEIRKLKNCPKSLK